MRVLLTSSRYRTTIAAYSTLGRSCSAERTEVHLSRYHIRSNEQSPMPHRRPYRLTVTLWCLGKPRPEMRCRRWTLSISPRPPPEPPAPVAPSKFTVTLTTDVGPHHNDTILLDFTRADAPHGADQFLRLCNIGFFDGAAFFRAVPDVLVQWGVSS